MYMAGCHHQETACSQTKSPFVRVHLACTMSVIRVALLSRVCSLLLVPVCDVIFKVVELSKWGNSTTDSVDNTELVASPLPPRGDVLEAISSPTTENLPQHLHRTVHLLNSVICPLGSSESQVLQHHTLAAQDDIMTHVTVDYGTGIPMIAGELVVKISTDIARDADNPEVSRVRVVVSVGDIRLPRLLRWLQGTIKHAVRASAVSQVTQWFTAMVEAEEAQRHTAT